MTEQQTHPADHAAMDNTHIDPTVPYVAPEVAQAMAGEEVVIDKTIRGDH